MKSSSAARRAIAMLGAALLLTVLLVLWRKGQYVEFRPIVLRDDAFVAEGPPSAAFTKRLETVLRCYGEPFRKTGDGRILVPRSLWSDRDLMWNYTTKARDPGKLGDFCLGAARSRP